MKVALCENEYANWLPFIGVPRKGRDKPLLHFCHGAPGIVIALAEL